MKKCPNFVLSTFVILSFFQSYNVRAEHNDSFIPEFFRRQRLPEFVDPKSTHDSRRRQHPPWNYKTVGQIGNVRNPQFIFYCGGSWQSAAGGRSGEQFLNLENQPEDIKLQKIRDAIAKLESNIRAKQMDHDLIAAIGPGLVEIARLAREPQFTTDFTSTFSNAMMAPFLGEQFKDSKFSSEPLRSLINLEAFLGLQNAFREEMKRAPLPKVGTPEFRRLFDLYEGLGQSASVIATRLGLYEENQRNAGVEVNDYFSALKRELEEMPKELASLKEEEKKVQDALNAKISSEIVKAFNLIEIERNFIGLTSCNFTLTESAQRALQTGGAIWLKPK